MDATAFCDRLDDRLRIDDYADLDGSANGLQVGTERGTVEHAAFAVDAAVATVDRAVQAGADVLVTHHGFVWGGLDRLTGRTYDRIAPLIENECALYVAHLPLDGHQDLGNAAGVADLLDLEAREPFGTLGEEHVGQRGHLAEPTGIDDVAARLDGNLETGDGAVRTFAFGPETVRDVAVVTGSGVDWLDEAIAAGVDVLITGEGKQQAYHEAREAGVHLVLAGHYATETFGVRALQSLVEEWGVVTTYVDHPTSL